MIRKTNAASVLMDIKKRVGRVAMEFVHPFVLSIKTGFKEDAYVNLGTIWSITTALNAPRISSMMFTKESAE
jgi:hypothetical protein